MMKQSFIIANSYILCCRGYQSMHMCILQCLMVSDAEVETAMNFKCHLFCSIIQHSLLFKDVTKTVVDIIKTFVVNSMFDYTEVYSLDSYISALLISLHLSIVFVACRICVVKQQLWLAW